MRNLEDSHLRKTRQGGNHRDLLGQESRVNQSHRLAVVLLLNVTEEKNNLRIRTNITLLAMGIVLEEDLLLCLEKPVNPAEARLDGMGTVIAHSLSSALGGTRTPNLLIRSQMLYPIEPRALNLICKD